MLPTDLELKLARLPHRSSLNCLPVIHFLIITSGRHRVDTELVAKNLGIAELGRADANYVKDVSGYSVGGVSPLGWISKPEVILIDEALKDYDIVWAAAGHPHAVFPTTYSELIQCTGAQPMVVGD
jgi:prolyl-tRNA editing enzyme YbaK/EbsC (Cys-tRNA(Pro) deacylase)